ncbi:ABC transporter ATP-binding protein [Aeromicrobium wangtongii]|uniref:ABC transporter ATP-binding protein n=1 Tax=Aeromicrobium wangtongii TaxID=2969247 RepID=A0ABY5MFM5_9ACTN|nr:ABC transporter ATP-binding protein [Aeromicrobium wangtongii]MCD9197154.1 ABC transporter ATP-binding protein [Aeromicrobium wangtongii]UUP14651.1 ABC transporter ATP-binding protein [Aeromicrobium wangtongii]
MSGDAAVEVRDLTKRYRGTAAVDGVSLTVRPGEVYGFLGPNGAGKTTTLRMLLGLVRPTSGRIAVLGCAPGAPEALARTGSMIEGPAFYPFLSGRQNLRVVARYAAAPASRIDHALRAVDLADRGDDGFSTYSLGMKQRLGVAAALLKEPDLVVLDEPTNGLDPAGMRDMRALIRRLGDDGCTVILSSHMLADVQQVCDRVGVIDAGRIVADSSVEDLRGDGELVIRAAPADVVRSTLEGLPFVQAVRSLGDGHGVRVDETRTGDVTRALVLAGADVREVRRVDRQLEDVFLELTTGAGSDA